MNKTPHQAQSRVNVALVAHIRKHGACMYGDLFQLFGVGLAPGDSKAAHAALRKKLEYLCYNDQLKANTKRGARRLYRLGNFAALDDLPEPPPEATPTPDDAPQPAPQRTPPRQIDVMHGNAYMYTLGPSLRPGSLDFQRYASFGNRC